MFDKKYNRLFAVGCSFTKYYWPTWASVISTELDIPLYNFGDIGASNPYIASQLFQIDATYNLTEDDLIIINWSAHGRTSSLGIEYHDFVDTWYHSGGYDSKPKRTDALTYRTNLLNSLVAIKGSLAYQDSLPCDCLNFRIGDISGQKESSDAEIFKPFATLEDSMYPSFLSILYPTCNNYQEVMDKYEEVIQSKPVDWYSKFRHRTISKVAIYGSRKESHPFPTEHVKILEELLNCTISDETKQKAKQDEKRYFLNHEEYLENRDFELERNQIFVSLPQTSTK